MSRSTRRDSTSSPLHRSQERFVCIFETGLLDDKTVDRMASLVWGEEDAES